MLKDQNIICIGPEVWNTSWLDVHRYMHLLAPNNRILYIERPVSIASAFIPGQRELFLPQMRQLFSNPVYEVEPNLYVSAPPPTIPLRFETPFLLINQFIRRNWVTRIAKNLKFKKPILWIYDSDAAPLVGAFGEKVSLYTITDDYANNPFYRNRKQQLRKWDTRLMQKVDLLLASASNLAAAKRDVNPNTHYIPHGVESDLFAQALDPDLPIPEDISNIPDPIIGFVGRVNEPINLEIIEAIVEANYDWQLVFVGPVAENEMTNRLRALDRVHCLGLKTILELPQYIKRMAVCIIPYTYGPRTRYTHPLKTLEYLAAGKPVVSTPMPALKPHEEFLYFAEKPHAFAQAVARALAEDTPEKQHARSYYTHDKTWHHQLENISSLIQECMIPT